jgi:hypothetical protein
LQMVKNGVVNSGSVAVAGIACHAHDSSTWKHFLSWPVSGRQLEPLGRTNFFKNSSETVDMVLVDMGHNCFCVGCPGYFRCIIWVGIAHAVYFTRGFWAGPWSQYGGAIFGTASQSLGLPCADCVGTRRRRNSPRGKVGMRIGKGLALEWCRKICQHHQSGSRDV